MIYISDGLIPQVEAFASKYSYSKFTKKVLDTALAVLSEKSENPEGNKYMFICNSIAYHHVQDELGMVLAQYHTDGAYLWSMKANNYVSVGPMGYDTYRYCGNEITFRQDKALTIEYPNKGYMIALDLTADKTSNQPPIALFTLKNGDLISNRYKGVNSTLRRIIEIL